MKRETLLYIYPAATSFILQDTKFFRELFRVNTFSFLPSHKLLLPFSFIRQKLFLLSDIRSASILVCHFAGYQSFLPVIFSRLFKKPCLIIAGGTDCVSFPSINYGNLRKPLLRWFTLWSLRHATHITVPSISLVEYEYTYHKKDYPYQGYRYFDPSIKTPFTVIHNGIDTEKFRPVDGIQRKKNSFLTVCNSIDKRNFLLKGLDLFIECARSFPEYEFTIIGKISKEFQFEAPPNLTIIDFIPNDKLPSKMSEFEFYCQLSMSEGFGVALAEAMSAGCVPIVSKAGILEQIAGDSGFVLEKYDKALLKILISSAVKSDVLLLSQKARTRVVENFNSEMRKESFITLFKTLLK